MKNIYLNCVFILFSFSLYSQSDFVTTYEQWKNKENHFVEYFDNKDQARVVFLGSKVFSSDGKGKTPAVSEGQAYGLLISYANDDQHLFDKLLRFVLDSCSKYGCVVFDKECFHKSFFLMPWMLDNKNEPFWYKPNEDSEKSYFSSGSATDADIQIAWALSLAIKKVSKGEWPNHYFQTFFSKADYKQIFHLMANEIRLYDIDWDKKIILPGSQWGEGGKNVFFAGYFTPQAFQALDKAPIPNGNDFPRNEEKNAKSYLLYIKNNTVKNIYLDLLQVEGEVYPNFQIIETNTNNYYEIPPLLTAKLIFFPKKNSSKLHIKIEADSNKMTAEYNLFANNRKWSIKDLGSSNGSNFTVQNDRVYISLTDQNFSKLQFSFSEVMTNSAKVISSFQKDHDTGLIPNIMYFDGKYPSRWEKTFSYDAIRYILWTTPYLTNNPSAKDFKLLKNILDKMMGEKGLLPFIKETKDGWTLPPEGIDAFTNKANNGWKSIAVALNTPVFLYAYFTKDKSLINKLGPPIKQYSIEKKQPSIFDPPNDSSAYYTACILLITKALIEGKLE